jgi:hypothetical protein
MYKDSKVHMLPDILQVADKGYTGIRTIHPNSLIPYKRPKNGKLTKYQKWFNLQIGSFRIKVEHVNRTLKRFKILQIRYRNKQRKHLLRVFLICGICNFQLGF